jgi:hypothetical protein
MHRLATSLLLLLSLVSGKSLAQEAAPLDGRQRPFQDSLFDQLAGNWFMSGSVGRRAVAYTVQAEWVLNHQFLRVAMRDTAQVVAYEAHVYIGRDNLSERYVAHWLDLFGGRWSETLGYGTRSGSSVEFVFEYPDGPFRTTFSYDGRGGWTVLMRQRARAGQWQTFAQFALRRT